MKKAKKEFKAGDIVKYKAKYLKDIQWVVDVPESGKIIEITKRLIKVEWSNGHIGSTVVANIMLESDVDV